MDTDSEAPGAVSQDQDERRRRRGLDRSGLSWCLAAVVVVVVAGSTPLLFTPAYYWRGDTQVAYFGAWYHLGTEFRAGHYPLMEPWAWRGGNHVVEGNFGLLSPIVMAIGLGATFVDNAISYLTVVKLLFLGVSAAGAFTLTRSYGGPRPLAFVAGVLVPLSGFTLYLDTPTWFPGMVVSGLLAVVWSAMRASLLRDRNPFAALLFGSLLSCMGYVFGTAMLAVVVAACMLDALLARGWRAAGKGLLIGVLIGIPSLVVRLPFVLSASVTSKTTGGIRSTGAGTTTITDLLLSTLPVNGAGAPLFYVSWLLPFLVFVDWGRFRRGGRDLVGLLLVWGVALAWALGPSNIGPLRYPMRLMPYVVLCTVLLGVLAFARARRARLSGRRLVLALLLTAVSGYVSASADVTLWRAQAAVTVLVGVGLVVLWLLLRTPSPARSSGRSGSRALPGPRIVAAAAFVGIWTIVVVGVQHHYKPLTFAVDRGMPGEISEYKAQLPGATGDVFMVGHVDDAVEPGSKPEPLVLIANAWYVSGLEINNVHANTGHEAYEKRYCFNYLGFTCRRALTELLATEPTTGRTRADLLSVNSLVLLKSDVGPRRRDHPPAGWRIAKDERMSVTWTREDPVPTAGGVAWASDGLDVDVVSRDDGSVRLAVGDVPAGGGEIVLSRIDWPGYQVSGATVTDPVDDYLLTLEVSPDQANGGIDVRYAPPRWGLLLTALGGAAAVSLLWSAGAALRAGRAWRAPARGRRGSRRGA